MNIKWNWLKFWSCLKDCQESLIYLQHLGLADQENVDADLFKHKELMNKLKFSYIELETKQLFLQQLTEPLEVIERTIQSQEDEQSLRPIKKLIATLKEQNKQAIDGIVQQCRQVEDG